MEINNSTFVILGLIALGILTVYFVLPKLFKNYSTEKGAKLLLFYGMMTYLSYDFYLKEKYSFLVFFALGAIAFTYMVMIAKKKEQ